MWCILVLVRYARRTVTTRLTRPRAPMLRGRAQLESMETQMAGKLNWEAARQAEQRRQSAPASKVIGSRRPIAPVHKHDWSDWESPPNTYATLERVCQTCGHTERGKLVRSEIAPTAADRNKIRARTRWRHGHALTPEGDLNQLYKQRRQNVRD